MVQRNAKLICDGLRMKFSSANLVFLLLILSACAGSPESLKNDPGFEKTIVVQENYQAVYRRVLHNLQKCWSPTSTRVTVEGHIEPTPRRAEIWLSNRLLVKNYIFIYEFVATGSQSTKSTLYTAVAQAGENLYPEFKSWIMENGSDCHMSTW